MSFLRPVTHFAPVAGFSTLWPHVPSGSATNPAPCLDEAGTIGPKATYEQLLAGLSRQSGKNPQTPAHVEAGVIDSRFKLDSRFWDDTTEAPLQAASTNVPVQFAPDPSGLTPTEKEELLTGVSQDETVIQQLLQRYKGQAVLIVDDDRLNVLLTSDRLKKVFEKAGIKDDVEIVSANDFDEAERWIQTSGKSFVLAFLDYDLGPTPSTGPKARFGAELLPLLDNGQTRAVLMTARDLNRSAVPELNRYDYAFGKPFNINASTTAGLILIAPKSKLP